MRCKKFILPLLIIISPFVLALTFGVREISPAQPTDSKAVVAEPGAETSRNDIEKITNRGRRDPIDNAAKESPNDNTDGLQPDNVIIEGSPVIATIVHNTKLYHTVNGGVMQDIQQGEQVEILQDRSWAWYEVSIGDTVGWVKAEALDIPPDPPTNPTRYSSKQLEDFINEQHFESTTPYLIWVDIDRQLVHAFKGSLDKWSLERTMICSTGKNISPTTRGLFTASDRDTWMFTPRLGSGAKYWVRFNHTYLFHSVAYAKDGETVVDDTLGIRSSAGCIRLSLEDSKWIYDNIEQGTTVWVN